MKTYSEMKEMIASEEYQRIGRKTTVCCIILKNGFEIIGEAYCEDENKFDFKIGKDIAFNNAFDKLYQIIAYHEHEEKLNPRWVFKANDVKITTLPYYPQTIQMHHNMPYTTICSTK